MTALESRVPLSIAHLREALRAVRAAQSGTVAERWEAWASAAQRAGCYGPHDLWYWLRQVYGERGAFPKPVRPRKPSRAPDSREFLDVEITDPPTPEPEADRRYGVAP